MTYTLTPEEIEKVRDLVRMLTHASQVPGSAVNTYHLDLSKHQTELVIELAREIQDFVQ